MFGRFFSGKAKVSLDDVVLDAQRYRHLKDGEGFRLWITPEGDGIELEYFAQKPPFPKQPEAAAEYLRGRYGAIPGATLGEVTFVDVDGLRSIWVLMKLPQKPHGTTYVATVHLPFADFSYNLKLQCVERPPTGLREAAVFIKAQQEGRVSRGPDGRMVGELNFDDAAHDAAFPMHPVSRVRREFGELRARLKFSELLKKQEPFFAA